MNIDAKLISSFKQQIDLLNLLSGRVQEGVNQAKKDLDRLVQNEGKPIVDEMIVDAKLISSFKQQIDLLNLLSGRVQEAINQAKKDLDRLVQNEGKPIEEVFGVFPRVPAAQGG